MAKRYDAVSPREYESGGETKTSWTRVGVAFQRDNGNIDVLLNCYPLPGPDGQAKISLMEPREGNGGNHGGGQRSRRGDDDGDRVPF